MADFKITTNESSSVAIMHIGGYLDAHTAPELEKEFDKLLKEKKYKVVINFKELNYISSAGLGVFMAYIETMRENGGDIKFCELKDDVYEIFDLLGFPVLYEFFETEDEAIKKFNE
jgi:anti-sigma B factor antagonist